MSNEFSSPVQSVSEVTRSIKGLLGAHFSFVSIRGEVSNVRTPYSGHTYFTLKDEKAQIRAVIFKQQQRYLTEPLKEGRQVVCSGKITVYEQRGEYQIIVDYVDFKGSGPLQAAFEQLKNKLAAEGLFDQDAKKPLPFLPQRIGVITSPTGAAVHDFLRMTRDRFPSVAVEIYPAKVQGAEAADEIITALHLANNRQTCQVLVLCRGGGSIEDLWPFNEESVARSIFSSDIPVVSAIGHEVDFTIADFVADFRAPTPTAAAEAVLPELGLLQTKNQELTLRLSTVMQKHIKELYQHVATQRRMITDPSRLLQHHLLLLDYTHSAMSYAMSAKINALRSRLAKHSTTLAALNPGQQLKHQQVLFKELARRFQRSIQPILTARRVSLSREAALLDAVSPLAVLGRGYALATLENGQLIRSCKQVKSGDKVSVVLGRGKLDCQVKKITDNPDN